MDWQDLAEEAAAEGCDIITDGDEEYARIEHPKLGTLGTIADFFEDDDEGEVYSYRGVDHVYARFVWSPGQLGALLREQIVLERGAA